MRARLVVAVLTAAFVGGLALGYPSPRVIPVQTTPYATTVAMAGNPWSGVAHWGVQKGNDCAMMAATNILNQFGVKVKEKAVIARARRIPGLLVNGRNTDAGTFSNDLPQLFGAYGPRSTVQDGTMLDLQWQLSQGDKVVAVVNGEGLWRSQGLLFSNTDTGADHAVVVDSVDPVSGRVTVTDSSWDGGATEVVPRAVFVASWATSQGNEVVVFPPKVP